MIQEFKQFAMRGNVVDLAVGVVIGSAFGKIVSSLVEDVLMPPIGYLAGGVDFSDKALVLSPATTDAPAVLLKYGMFLNSVVNFLIVAFAIFFVVKQMNKLMPKEQVAPALTKDCPSCFSQVSVKATKCAYCTSTLTVSA